MGKRPIGKTSYRKNVLQDKMSDDKTSYGAKCLMTKRLTGQNVLRVNHPRGQNVQRDKVSYGTKPITGQNVLVTKLPPGKTSYGTKCPSDKTSSRKNILRCKMSYEKTSYEKNVLQEKRP